MAVTSPHEDDAEQLARPILDARDLDRIAVRYVSDLDTLYVHLYGRSLPAVWDPRGDRDIWIGTRLGADEEITNDVVGIIVEHFRSRALEVYPRWRDVDEIADKVDRPGVISGASAAQRRSSIARFISDVALMGV